MHDARQITATIGQLSDSHVLIILTVPTRPNLTESGLKPDLRFAFGVRSGSTKMDQEQTQNEHKTNPERTPSRHKANLDSEPHFKNETIKMTQGPLYVTELSIRITEKLS